MNQELIEKLKNRLEQLETDGKFCKAKIYLFGMNTPGDRVLQFLQKKGYSVSGILDNNKKNHGKSLMGITVYNPNILQNIERQSIRVLICSRYYPEMKLQLQQMGYVEEEHIIKLLEMNASTQLSCEEKFFYEAKQEVKKGFDIYKRLLEQYGENTDFLLSLCANGDIYIGASLMKEYQKKQNSSKVVLVLVGGVGKKIGTMFNIEDIVRLQQEELMYLLSFVRVLGTKNTKLQIINPEVLYFNIFANMECYKSLNFMDFIANGMLGLNNGYEISKPKNKLQKEKIFSDRDVIIAPYANSLPSFMPEFWIQLVKKLQKKGYYVYTNSTGDMEPAIEGTQPVCLPLENMIQALNDCAAFIAIRNGLCDVVSSVLCKKIILYPEKGMGYGTVKEYFSLNAMGLCDDAIELVYKEGQEEYLIKQILCVFEEEEDAFGSFVAR